MVNTKKLFHALKIVVALYIVSMLFSCTPYRYFPSRVQFYSFDTCKEARIVLEPYLLGYNIGAAFSITNHLALTANYHRDHAYTGDFDEESAPIISGETFDKAYNFGVGYFYKFNANSGIDLFAQYEHEKVNGQKYFNYDPYYKRYNNNDTINYKYHSFSLQTSCYSHGKDKNMGVSIGLRGTVLIDNTFTNDTTINKITVTRHYKLGDFILTPGIDIKLSVIHLGMYYNWDTSGKDPLSTYFYRPFVLNMKVVIPIPYHLTKRNHSPVKRLYLFSPNKRKLPD